MAYSPVLVQSNSSHPDFYFYPGNRESETEGERERERERESCGSGIRRLHAETRQCQRCSDGESPGPGRPSHKEIYTMCFCIYICILFCFSFFPYLTLAGPHVKSQTKPWLRVESALIPTCTWVTKRGIYFSTGCVTHRCVASMLVCARASQAHGASLYPCTLQHSQSG